MTITDTGPNQSGAVVPAGLLVAYDLKKKVIDVHVKFPPGKHTRRCVLEISTDPIGAATWHRLDGDGVKRALSGYAPGTYWLRAASSVATGRSEARGQEVGRRGERVGRRGRSGRRCGRQVERRER